MSLLGGTYALSQPSQFPERLFALRTPKSVTGGMNMDVRTHWEKIYTTKAPDQVSWYRPHLETSLALIKRSAVGPSSSIIDVGGGESTLVDDLLAHGFLTDLLFEAAQKFAVRKLI
jgi:hypothetical protein